MTPLVRPAAALAAVLLPASAFASQPGFAQSLGWADSALIALIVAQIPAWIILRIHRPGDHPLHSLITGPDTSLATRVSGLIVAVLFVGWMATLVIGAVTG